MTIQSKYTCVKGTVQSKNTCFHGTVQSKYACVKGTVQSKYTCVHGTVRSKYTCVKRTVQSKYTCVKGTVQIKIHLLKGFLTYSHLRLDLVGLGVLQGEGAGLRIYYVGLLNMRFKVSTLSLTLYLNLIPFLIFYNILNITNKRYPTFKNYAAFKSWM